MKRLLLTGLLFLMVTSPAHAFVFTDVVAKVQRIVMIGHATKHLEEFQKYQSEFDYYKKEFDKYFVNFKRVYRRLSPSDWKDFTPANWGHLYDHVIGVWKTFDPVAYDTQVAALKLSPLYTWSAEHKDYVDRLVALSDQQVDHLKKKEAHLMMLQAQDAAHHDALERFKSRNAGLVMGEDSPGNEVALTQQVALLNAILIEIASIQAETKVVQQRLLTQQQEARNLIMRMKQLEIESQKGDSKNLELRTGLSAVTVDGYPHPITASLGVATLLTNELPLHLVERADAALYLAKRNGRNRVESGPNQPEQLHS